MAYQLRKDAVRTAVLALSLVSSILYPQTDRKERQAEVVGEILELDDSPYETIRLGFECCDY
jgi:hypothetical protein